MTRIPLVSAAYHGRVFCEIGERLAIFKFADDIPLTAESEQDPQKILKTMDEVMEKNNNMKINKNKTKTVV